MTVAVAALCDLLLIRESSRASDLLRLVVELSMLSVGVRHRALAVAAIVTQLVTHRGATHYEEELTRLALSTESLPPCSQGFPFHLRPTSSTAAVSSSVSTIEGWSAQV